MHLFRLFPAGTTDVVFINPDHIVEVRTGYRSDPPVKCSQIVLVGDLVGDSRWTDVRSPEELVRALALEGR
jgi:hypothetical protein